MMLKCHWNTTESSKRKEVYIMNNGIGYRVIDGMLEIVDCAGKQNILENDNRYTKYDKKGEMIQAALREAEALGVKKYAGRYERETMTIRMIGVPAGKKAPAEYEKTSDNLYALYFECSLKRGLHKDELRR
jgi:hypothetical protein